MLPLPQLMQDQSDKVIADLGFDPQMLTANQRRVLAFSDFIIESLQQHPEWWQQLTKMPPQSDENKHYSHWLAEALDKVEDETLLMVRLRQFRCHMLVRIAWLQTLSLATTEQCLQLLSRLAEVLISAARDWLWPRCCQELGTPCNQRGVPQPLLILGMGKLGGGELNFSSDIDLIFTWPEHGATQGGRRSLDNAQFFTRMGQRLIKILDQITSAGRVYRVDMRLRPFGDSGPLVLSFAALEDYYQEQGRDWERYAMVKVKLLTAEQIPTVSQELTSMLRPFVYRRYIDFSVIQSLRTMKSKINREVRRRGLINNIKLGAGGIRECEFIVQVFQLVRGGREPSLQQRNWLLALGAVEQLGLLPNTDVQSLREAYLFLRRLENLLQSIADQQTQTLPKDPLDQARLAWAMGYQQWSALQIETDRQMAIVRKIFNQLIGDEEDTASTEQANELWHSLWLDRLCPDELLSITPQLGADQRQQLISELGEFQQEISRRTVGPRGRQALDQLMPELLQQVCLAENSMTLLQRIIPLLTNIVTRSTYLELLIEYPQALQHLLRLCAASSMIATLLARYPLLLDELLDPSTLYQPTAVDCYRDELRQYLLRIPVDDEEQQLEGLRQFKLTQQLRIAAADIAGTLSVMKVSDHLTWLAEAILEAVIQQAWQQMINRYGLPAHLNPELEEEHGFAVAGYGKLGGWELGYTSDLDLVFLHNCPDNIYTTGSRVIDGRQFYLRLAQRIIHLFSVRTASGILYEVDARLRPSGSAGMLVTTFAAFADYQTAEAWTWEHQALVRARIVYASALLRQQFDSIRQRVLCLPRDPENLKHEVRAMRSKMLAHLGNKHLPAWDIKVDRGGLIDIEFIAQYLVLCYASQQPALTSWSDNIRIFEQLAQYQWLSEAEASDLSSAYISLRDALHHRTLQALPGVVSSEAFEAQRAVAFQSWQRWLED